MRILCAINPPEAIQKILDCLGLPSRSLPIFPTVSLSSWPLLNLLTVYIQVNHFVTKPLQVGLNNRFVTDDDNLHAIHTDIFAGDGV